MHVDGFLKLSNFSPEGPSLFSISGELGDKSVLAVDQKASRERGQAEVRVSVNPLQRNRLVGRKKKKMQFLILCRQNTLQITTIS